MKLGQTVGAYTIVTEPQAGGMGKWALAEAGGQRYFIKAFLSPKYPKPTSPGSPATKARLLAECVAFEARHNGIRRAIRADAEGGGNLVVTVDFFRIDSTYYKVTEHVESVRLPLLATLEPRQTLTILRTLLFSLRLLHGERVVHSDIKLDNIMFKEPSPGTYVTKLIDFDEAYLAGRPPPRDEIVGDQRFYSPELLLYIKEDESVNERDMTTASDIFSLALLIHLVLTGELPAIDRDRHEMACQAALSDDGLKVTQITGGLGDILNRMLAADPTKRPTVHRVIDEFTSLTPESLATMLPGIGAGELSGVVAPKSGHRVVEPPREEDHVVDEPPRTGRLRGSAVARPSVPDADRADIPTKPPRKEMEEKPPPPSEGKRPRLKSTFDKS